MQHPHQRVDVTVEAELGCDRTRAVAQASVRFWILETRDDGVGKPARCRRVAWGKVAVDPWTKPVWYAADGERRRQEADAARLRGRRARTAPARGWAATSRSAAAKSASTPDVVEPAREDDAKRSARVTPSSRRPPATRRSRGSVSGKRDVERRLRRPHDTRQRVEQIAPSLEMIHSSDEQEAIFVVWSPIRDVGAGGHAGIPPAPLTTLLRDHDARTLAACDSTASRSPCTEIAARNALTAGGTLAPS